MYVYEDIQYILHNNIMAAWLKLEFLEGEPCPKIMPWPLSGSWYAPDTVCIYGMPIYSTDDVLFNLCTYCTGNDIHCNIIPVRQLIYLFIYICIYMFMYVPALTRVYTIYLFAQALAVRPWKKVRGIKSFCFPK